MTKQRSQKEVQVEKELKPAFITSNTPRNLVAHHLNSQKDLHVEQPANLIIAQSREVIPKNQYGGQQSYQREKPLRPQTAKYAPYS